MAGVSLPAGASVVVAWRTGVHVQARLVKVGGAVSNELRKYAEECAALLDADAATYDPDSPPEDDSQRTASRDEALDTELLESLAKGVSQSEAKDADLDRTLACWAVVTGSGKNSVIFVRRRSPILLANKPLVAGLMDNTLTKIDSKIFAFERNFDLVITADKLYILNQTNFEALFKESKAVLAQVGKWAEAIVDRLPIAASSEQVLADVLQKNSAVRRKVSSILRRDWLPKVTTGTIEAGLKAHGMEPAEYMTDGELVFTPANVQDLVRFLNEDLFTGDFSGDRFAAAAKHRVAAK